MLYVYYRTKARGNTNCQEQLWGNCHVAFLSIKIIYIRPVLQLCFLIAADTFFRQHHGMAALVFVP